MRTPYNRPRAGHGLGGRRTSLDAQVAEDIEAVEVAEHVAKADVALLPEPVARGVFGALDVLGALGDLGVGSGCRRREPRDGGWKAMGACGEGCLAFQVCSASLLTRTDTAYTIRFW
jgi:hypothetical protein